MEKPNNICTLFDNLQEIDVFDKDFAGKSRSVYNSFFSYDRKLLTEKPQEYSFGNIPCPLPDGRFCLDYNGGHFEAFFKRAKGSADNLIVSFNCARNMEKAPPQFHKMLVGSFY